MVAHTTAATHQLKSMKELAKFSDVIVLATKKESSSYGEFEIVKLIRAFKKGIPSIPKNKSILIHDSGSLDEKFMKENNIPISSKAPTFPYYKSEREPPKGTAEVLLFLIYKDQWTFAATGAWEPAGKLNELLKLVSK